MSLKPWREVAVPHEDVLKGTFQQAEFAADLSRVHEGTATPEYQNPMLFFQRTRGVLKLMAKVIHRLWKDNDKDPPIMPGSFPLQDADTRNEVIYYLPQGWDPVVERAETTEIENRDTRLGSVQACRRSARAIFLGSAPSTANQMVRGIELERVALGVAQPGQQVGIYKDALRRLGDRLHYLNSGNDRFWFDTRPNLRREMEERKRRFQDKEDVFPAIRDRVQKTFASGVFGGIHIFTASSDVPYDWHRGAAAQCRIQP